MDDLIIDQQKVYFFADYGVYASAVDAQQAGVPQSAIDAVLRQAAASDAKRIGEVYADTGITVPFASEDALALMQVQAAFGLGVKNTVIQFSNGAELPMTPDKFPAFASWFVNKRNSFYQD